MKKINFMCIVVLITIIASLTYAFHELYIYRNTNNSAAVEIETTTTKTAAETETTTTEETAEIKINWAEEFEKSFRCSNAQYEEIASDVNKNITTIEPVEQPNF